jgi:hypothetical protein
MADKACLIAHRTITALGLVLIKTRDVGFWGLKQTCTGHPGISRFDPHPILAVWTVLAL